MNKLLPVILALLMSIREYPSYGIGNTNTPSLALAWATARITSHPKCNSTLQSVKKSLTGVMSFEQNSLGDRGQPRGRSQTLDITFKDEASFPNDKIQMAIATRIIQSCSKIASVTFAFYQADGYTYGIKNGQIIEFTCADASRFKKPAWGEIRCP